MASSLPPLFVVTLRHQIARRQRLEQDLASTDVTAIFNTDLRIDVDAAQMSLDSIRGLRLFPWKMSKSSNPWWRRDLKIGEIACSLAHHRLWELIANESRAGGIIFEDDAVPRPGFEDAVAAVLAEADELRPSWDFIYLGRRRWGRDRGIPGSSKLVRPGFSPCLHAYVVSAAGARKLRGANIVARMMPADDFVPALMGVHPRPDVCAEVPNLLNALALSRDVVGVLPRSAWGSTTEASRYITAAEVGRYT